MKTSSQTVFSFLCSTLILTTTPLTVSGQVCGVLEESPTPIQLPGSIKLERVRYCQGKSLCRDKVTRDEFEALDNAFDGANQEGNNNLSRDLYLSEVRVPPRQSTKNIALFFAGAQRGGGIANGVTGQRNGYYFKPEEKKKHSTNKFEIVGLDPSLAKRILETKLFSSTDTFVGLVFNTKFDPYRSGAVKANLVDAYIDYIQDRLSQSSDVETIYLGGSSRGGCLALVLAKGLTRIYPTARIIVQTFDPVCSDERFGVFTGIDLGTTTSNPRDNPTVGDPEWYVFTTNFENQYTLSRRQCLDIRSQLSGNLVEYSDLAENLVQFHGVGHFSLPDGNDDVLFNEEGRPWYTQSFHPLGHFDINRDAGRWEEAVEHFRNAMSTMPCPCGGPPKPTQSPTEFPSATPTEAGCCVPEEMPRFCDFDDGAAVPESDAGCCPGGRWACGNREAKLFRCDGPQAPLVPVENEGDICEKKCCVGLALGDVCLTPDRGCCSDGTSTCGVAGQPFSFNCFGKKVFEPKGEDCCCPRDTRPVCSVGVSACCPRVGTWVCRDRHDADYECPSATGQIVGREQGDVCGEDGFTYKLPPWWDIVNNQYDNVRRCFKREFPPTTGDSCGTFPKKCFWGERNVKCIINGVVFDPPPKVMCECQGASPGTKGTWACSSVNCDIIINDNPAS